MPYTPNNPYIPGDPYSYDLKWLVSQVKAHRAILETLDERIKKIVTAQLDQHDPVYYQTAQELIDSAQKAPSIAYIEGYYAAGDGGANLYYVTDDYNDIITADFYLTLNGANRWAIPVILTPYVTPQMFGAYADGINDDLAAIQTAAKYMLPVYFKKGSYLVSDSIHLTDTKCTFKGANSEDASIVYDGASFAVVCDNSSIRWRNDQYNFEDLSISAPNGGTVKFDNATQSTIKNCRLYCAGNTNRDNVLLTNQSHYAIIENCFIYGGNGIHITSDTNGVNVNNCYVTYCNIAFYLEGGQHVIKHNDAEGSNTLPYLIACNGSEIDAHGERNITSSSYSPWVQITGNQNRIHCRMQSDGGAFYYPMIESSGDMNRISVDSSSGYELVRSDTGNGNVYDVIAARGLLNTAIISKARVDFDKFQALSSASMMFDIDNDDLTPYIANASGITYDPATHNITITAADNPLQLDFSSLAAGEQYYMYYEFTGISAPTHGRMTILANGSSGAALTIYNQVVYVRYPNNTTPISEIGSINASWKIDKLRLCKYFTPDLWA